MPSKEQHLKLITTHHTLTTIVQKFLNYKKKITIFFLLLKFNTTGLKLNNFPLAVINEHIYQNYTRMAY